MNFFKSVFSDDPDPGSDPGSNSDPQTHDNPSSSSSPPDPNPTWSLGGLMKTLQVDPTWVETYTRDLQEFGSGLKKETQILRDVASKAVQDLPDSVHLTASVGQALDTVWKSTAQIKDSLLSLDNNNNLDFVDNHGNNDNEERRVSVGRYSRWEVMLRGLQEDVNTYVGEVEDVAEFERWRLGFDLGEKKGEIEGLMRENGSVAGIYRKLVPSVVEEEVFWLRYYYRVNKLREANIVRAAIVKRAIQKEDDELMSWDDDEDEEVEGGTSVLSKNEENISKNEGNVLKKEGKNEGNVLKEEDKNEGNVSKNEREEARGEDLNEVEKSVSVVKEEVVKEGENDDEEDEDETVGKKGEKGGKGGASESGKESDVSVVSTQPSNEEDDMGWDEIEDIASGDEKRVSESGGGTNRGELRKRLSAAEDDEDLSWDIEDDE